MSHYSRDEEPLYRSRSSREDRFPAPEWMIRADMRSLEDSIESLTDAINDIEDITMPLVESGIALYGHNLDFSQAQRLSSDFQTIYNECAFLMDRYSARFNAEDLTYLRHLRRLCAHRFGSSMDRSMLLQVAVCEILPMKESIRSCLIDVLDRNPGTGLRERVRTFNRRLCSRHGWHDRFKLKK